MKAVPNPPPAIRILRVAIRGEASRRASGKGNSPALNAATEPSAEETTNSLSCMIRPPVEVEVRRSVARPGYARCFPAVVRPVRRPMARRAIALDELRIFAGEVYHQCRERRVVLQVVEDDLVVRVAVGVPGIRVVVPT